MIKKIGILCFAIFTIFACDNEPIDNDFNSGNVGGGSNTGGGNPGGGDTGGDPGGSSTGDYWPMAMGNVWDYNNTEDGIAQEDSDMTINATETIDGNLFYKYNSFVGDATATDGTDFVGVDISMYSRKNGGDYHVRLGDLTADLLGIYQIEQEGYEYIILKDYLDVGQTWTQDFTIETSYTVLLPGTPDLPVTVSDYSLQFEILGKDLTVEVNGVTYTSVIKVMQILSTEVQGTPGSSTESELEIYFAKDIGIIKADTSSFDEDSGVSSTTVQELISYSLN